MAELYTPLPVSAQAAYSELLEALHYATHRRSVADLSGSFASKTVKGKRYWYFAFRDAVDGKVRQLYVGPDSPQVKALVEAKAQVPSSQEQLQRQAVAALALGCTSIVAQHVRIIRQFEQAGFFRAGGVLVGSHAFASYANMLGAAWRQSAQTLDVDFAIGRPDDPIALVAPTQPVDVPSAVESLAMGFVPHAALGGASYESSKDIGLRIDFLTPQGRAGRSEYVEALGIPLQPLPFLDYLIEAPAQVAVIDPRGVSVLVNVPDPARYAVHKLIVSQERSARERAKAAKDVAQAAALIEHHLDMAAMPLVMAWQAAVQRGKGWTRRLEGGLRAMLAHAPHLEAPWRSIVEEDARYTAMLRDAVLQARADTRPGLPSEAAKERMDAIKVRHRQQLDGL